MDNRSNSNAHSISTLELAKIHHTIESGHSREDKAPMLRSIEMDDYTSTPLKPLQKVKGFRAQTKQSLLQSQEYTQLTTDDINL